MFNRTKEPEEKAPEQEQENPQESPQENPQAVRGKQRYLRNTKTGAVFAYNRRMAGMAHMEVLDEKPDTDKPSPAKRKATFPLSRKDREAAELKRRTREQRRQSENEQRRHESETLSDQERLLALGERIKKIKPKKEVIEVALEELGVQIDLQDANGNDRNIADLKREAIEVINARLQG